MRVSRTNRVLAIALGWTLVLLVAQSAAANEKGWVLRFNGYLVDSGFDVDTINQFGNRVRVDASVGGGVGLTSEYRFNRRLGLEFGFLASSSVDLGLRVDTPPGAVFLSSAALSMAPFMVGLNVHLTPQSKLDLYAGPVLAHVVYSNVTFGFGGPAAAHVDLDSEHTFGAVVGLDVPIGSKGWLFNTNLRYLDSSFVGRNDVGEPVDVNLDPLMLGIGFGYRF